MEDVLPFLIGCLYAGGIYLIFHRSFVKLIIGLVILGYASNLFLFTISRLTRAAPPLIPNDATELTEPFADPLPQALILTAIVIGFGLQAFAIVLIKVGYKTLGTGDLDDITATDRMDN